MNDQPPEQLIAGRFALGELIGSGGTASVFHARDEAHGGRAVALKLLHPHLSETEAERRGFFAEAEAARLVESPAVLQVVDSGVHEAAGIRHAWIATELAPGATIGDLVRRRGALPPAEALEIAEGLLRGVAAIHAAGLVHRDLAPGNIVVTGDDATVCILDFGLADRPGRPATGEDLLRSEPAGTDARVVGSVAYLSPEHALGHPVDERGDLYQVAALLHLMVTGRPPFVRATAAQVMAAHVGAPPPVPSVLDSAVPRAVDRIVVRGMLKQPAARYQTADEMREAVSSARSALADGIRASATSVLPVAPPTVAVARQAPVGGAVRPAQPAKPPPPAPPAAPAAPAPSDPPRRRTAAMILALSLAAIATIWLIAANSVPRAAEPIADPTTAPITPSPTPTPVPTPTRSTVPVPVPIPVPTVAGLTQADAEARLRESGLGTRGTRSSDSVRPAGTVLSSDPAAGSRMPAGSTIVLVVASGWNTVPDILGSSGVDAGGTVARAGFGTAVRTVVDSTVPENSVLGTEPGAGTRLSVGSTVTIVVSAAAHPEPTGTPTTPATPAPTPTGRP